jgi:methionyl-tRNA formyltransferase
LKIVFAGTTTNAVEVLRYLQEQQRHEIVAVVTREDAPVGRKRILTPSPVADYAQSQSLNLIKTNKISADIEAKLANLNFDLGLVIAYGALLRKSTLDLAPKGWLNIHFSKLPMWRGAAPVQRSIMAGDTETAITIFRLDEGMDTGDIVTQVSATIEPDDNTTSLLDRLTRVAISALDETLSSIEAGIAKFEPQTGAATLAPKLRRDDVRVNWQKSNKQVEWLVHGANPEPMAWTTLAGEALRIIEARAIDRQTNGAQPGSVHLVDSRVLVATASGLLELVEVQPASKSQMRAIDWMRGKSGQVIFE